MLYTIDIGNSNIEIARHSDPVETFRFETDKKQSSDEYYQRFKAILTDLDAVMISNVVPALTQTFERLFERYYDTPAVMVGPGVKTGVKLPITNPKEVGADLVSAAAGAMALGYKDAIIIDCGTATTVSLLENGALKGVSIMIGLETARECLVSNASQLLDFHFQIPDAPIGDTTLTALNAGFLYGHMYQIQGFVEALKTPTSAVFITGGAHHLIHSLIPETYTIDPILIHRGLKAMHETIQSR